MRGIDVSQHEGIIDWEKVKDQIEYAILRLGWIGNSECRLDTQFERNYSECKRLGIPIGVYVFNYVKTPERAAECASWTLEQLTGKTLELPVFIDMENDESQDFKLSSIGKDVLTDIVVAFNSVIESAGLKAGVYANLDWYLHYLHAEQLQRDYIAWIAHWGANEDKYEGKFDILQYSESVRISGISDNVDMDIMYVDLISGNVPQGTKTN